MNRSATAAARSLASSRLTALKEAVGASKASTQPTQKSICPDGEITDEMVDEAIAAMNGKEWWRSVSPTTASTWRVDMRRALAAALAVQPGSRWRPIAEAKWDGPAVDLWGRRTYSEPPRRFVDCRYRLEYMNNGDEGWYDAEGKRVVWPTHFITIPDPPNEDK